MKWYLIQAWTSIFFLFLKQLLYSQNNYKLIEKGNNQNTKQNWYIKTKINSHGKSENSDQLC